MNVVLVWVGLVCLWFVFVLLGIFFLSSCSCVCCCVGPLFLSVLCFFCCLIIICFDSIYFDCCFSLCKLCFDVYFCDEWVSVAFESCYLGFLCYLLGLLVCVCFDF